MHVHTIKHVPFSSTFEEILILSTSQTYFWLKLNNAACKYQLAWKGLLGSLEKDCWLSFLAYVLRRTIVQDNQPSFFKTTTNSPFQDYTTLNKDYRESFSGLFNPPSLSHGAPASPTV